MGQSVYYISMAFDTALEAVLPNNCTFIAENDTTDLSTVANPTGMLWARSTLIPAITTAETFGPNGYIKVNGIYVVDCIAPLDKQYVAAKQLADTIMGAFTPGAIITLGNGDFITVDTASPSINTALGAWNFNKWYATQVQVKYFGYVQP